ncbi:MAG: ABC transporter ATP-binding protein [Candidatus Hodarchaeota archaeon]
MRSNIYHPLIEIKNLFFSYTSLDNSIFKNVNLKILPGELVGIIGESGSGKTTLLKILAGLVKPLQGSIKIKCSTKGSFVFQSPVLLNWLNVEQNIVFPKHKRNNEDDYLKRLLVDIGLESAKKKYPRELSGGMRSRVQLARSLYHEPQILFLDEAFSALDEKLRYQSNMLLKNLHSKYAFSAFIVSHSVQEAVFLSDRIIIIKKDKDSYKSQIIQIKDGLRFSDKNMDILNSKEFYNQVFRVRNKLIRD